MAVLEKQRSTGAAGVSDAVAVGGAADETAADNHQLLLRLQQINRRRQHPERQAEPPRQLGSGELAGEVQHLEHELQHQIERETAFFECLRRDWVGNDVSCQ